MSPKKKYSAVLPSNGTSTRVSGSGMRNTSPTRAERRYLDRTEGGNEYIGGRETDPAL